MFQDKPWKAAASINHIALLQIKAPMHNTEVDKGFFNCRVWLGGQAHADLVKHGVIHCDNIPALEQETITVTEADKVREEVEQGKRRATVNVSKLSH
jgi:hypothetical protein